MSELRDKLADINFRIEQAFETIDVFRDASETSRCESLTSGLELVSSHLRRASEDLQVAASRCVMSRAVTTHETQRLVDLARGMFALLEPEEPSETAITAARWLSMELLSVARAVDRTDQEETRRVLDARREVRS